MNDSNNNAAVYEEEVFGSGKEYGFGGAVALEKYWDIIRSNKLLIAGVIAICLAIGLISSLLATPKYLAFTRIEISQAQQNITNVEGLQDEAVLQDRNYLPTQYELLESRSLAMRVVRDLDLANDDTFLEAFEVEESNAVSLDDRLADLLLANVRIQPIASSSLVDIGFSSPVPSVSAQIADAWANAFIEENLNRRFGAAIEAREFLEERLAQTRDQLEAAERDLIAYATDQELLSINPDGDRSDSSSTAAQTLVATELASFNRALLEATADRIAAEAALASRRGATAESEAASSTGVTANLRARKSELEIELAELRSRFEDGYPGIRSVQDQIAQVDRAIVEEQSNSLARLQADFNEASAREARLRSRVNALQGDLVAQRQSSVQYNILQREVDTNRELYAGLLQRYREIGVVGVGESNVLIVDAAETPSVPYEPRPLLSLIVSLLVGLILVAAGVYLYDLLNQSVRDPKDVEKRLGVSLLGSIPKVDEGDIVGELAQSYTHLYESYFSLTASVASKNNGVVPRSIMITSSRPGEGKSLSSVALAYLLARQGKRVLLLDSDLRKSGIGKYVEGESQTGLTQYLLGNDDWRSMVQKSAPLEGFDLLWAGRKSLSVAELLSNNRFQTLLDEVEAAYDHVIVDGPPVLGLVDAPLVAATLDSVLLVIEANEGKWRYLEGAVQRLRHSNADVIGAVVTKLDERNSMYGYGSTYGYGYGYGEERDGDDERAALAQ